jgi:hypothetical protein
MPNPNTTQDKRAAPSDIVFTIVSVPVATERNLFIRDFRGVKFYAHTPEPFGMFKAHVCLRPFTRILSLQQPWIMSPFIHTHDDSIQNLRFNYLQSPTINERILAN